RVPALQQRPGRGTQSPLYDQARGAFANARDRLCGGRQGSAGHRHVCTVAGVTAIATPRHAADTDDLINGRRSGTQAIAAFAVLVFSAAILRLPDYEQVPRQGILTYRPQMPTILREEVMRTM